MAYKIEIFHLATIHYSNFTALHLFSWTIFCANYHGISMIKPNSVIEAFLNRKVLILRGYPAIIPIGLLIPKNVGLIYKSIWNKISI
jgi:hypothetical protein